MCSSISLVLRVNRMDPNVVFAFSLTLLAGLCTGIGSALAFFTHRTNTRFLSVALGFSAGVMIYVSMIEIFAKARVSLTEAAGSPAGEWIAVAAFFAGIALIALIDKFIPEPVNPHESHRIEEIDEAEAGGRRQKLFRMGIFTAIAIAIHNFPEGLATFMAALDDPRLGIAIAVAIAIHNIPEGIAVSIPVYYATGDRRKAFLLSLSSGIAEPVGVVVGYALLRPFMNELSLGIVFAGVAGIMVFISLDQLLPTAREYGEHHLSIYGLVSGMAVMALSLLLLL